MELGAIPEAKLRGMQTLVNSETQVPEANNLRGTIGALECDG